MRRSSTRYASIELAAVAALDLTVLTGALYVGSWALTEERLAWLLLLAAFSMRVAVFTGGLLAHSLKGSDTGAATAGLTFPLVAIGAASSSARSLPGRWSSYLSSRWRSSPPSRPTSPAASETAIPRA